MVAADPLAIARGATDDALLEAIYEAPVPTWIFDQQTLQFVVINQAAIREYGYSREEFLSLTVLDIRPCTDIPVFLNSAVLRHHSSTTPEAWRHLRKNNETFQVKIESVQRSFQGRAVEVVRATPVNH